MVFKLLRLKLGLWLLKRELKSLLNMKQYADDLKNLTKEIKK